MSDSRIKQVTQALAEMLAHRRTGGGVYMDGSHGPLPTEYLAAQRFVTDLVEMGWIPPDEVSW